VTTTIKTLIPDIYQLLREKHNGWFTTELARQLSDDLSSRLRGQLGEKRHKPTLRMSGLGKRCPRALWYSIHHPELAEPIPPWAEVKFAFGHIIEGLTLTLVEATGHSVEGAQDELVFEGITGHRDAVIDGCTVDIKSASSLSFQKFKSPDFALVDNFGYLEQLDSYTLAAADDPLVLTKDKGYLLAVDKQLGHMHLYEHHVTNERAEQLKSRISYYRTIVGQDHPPSCTCDVEEQANGNIKLGWRASYSPYKWECFPNLRAFKYAGGLEYLARVVKRPFNKYGPLPEIDRYGNTLY
jgi:hypothetical protein